MAKTKKKETASAPVAQMDAEETVAVETTTTSTNVEEEPEKPTTKPVVEEVSPTSAEPEPVVSKREPIILNAACMTPDERVRFFVEEVLSRCGSVSPSGDRLREVTEWAKGAIANLQDKE